MIYDDFIKRFNPIKSDLRRRKANYFNLRDDFRKLITDLINSKNQEDSKCTIRELLVKEFNWSDEDALLFTDGFSRLKDVCVQTLMLDKFDLDNCIWLLLVRLLNNMPIVCFDKFKSCLDSIIYDAITSLKGCYSSGHSSLITSYENEVKLEHFYNYRKSWNKTVGDYIDSSIFNDTFGTSIEKSSVPFGSAFATYLQQNNYSNVNISSYVDLYSLMVRSCDYKGKETVCLEQVKKYLEEGLISIDFKDFSIKATKTSSLKHFSDIKFIYIYSMRYDTCGFVSLGELSKLIFPFDCLDVVNAKVSDVSIMLLNILNKTYETYKEITDTLLAKRVYLSLSFIDYLEDNKCPFKKMEVEIQNGNIAFSHDLSDRLNNF